MLERILKLEGWNDLFFVFLSAVAIIGIWRGLWNIFDVYLLPKYFLLSQILSIAGGLIMLYVLSKYK